MESQSSKLVIAPTGRLSSLPINLLLDGRKLGDGGIGVYTENLIRGLLVVGGAKISVLTHPERVSTSMFGKDVTWVLDRAKPYSMDEMVWMPRRISFAEYDLFHAPHYTLPFGIPIPKVVTVHDLIHITHPERSYYPFIARRMITSAVHRADKIIAVSEHTREQLISEMGVPPSKVTWVPNAAARVNQEPAAPRGGLQKKVSELKPYLLAVFSNLKPHKGFPDLVKAFLQAREELINSASAELRVGGSAVNPRTLKLVLVGQGTEELMQAPELLRLIADSDAIHVLGRVSDEELTYLYSGARGVVISSLAEGFCLPALEAQAQGTRVIARPVPAIKEIVSSNDVVARDLSRSAFSDAIIEGVLRPQLSPSEALKNRDRLQRYSIENTASEVCSVYQSVLSKRKA